MLVRSAPFQRQRDIRLFIPAIERVAGKPIGELIRGVRSAPILSFDDGVAWVAREYGIGDGYARIVIILARDQSLG